SLPAAAGVAVAVVQVPVSGGVTVGETVGGRPRTDGLPPVDPGGCGAAVGGTPRPGVGLLFVVPDCGATVGGAPRPGVAVAGFAACNCGAIAKALASTISAVTMIETARFIAFPTPCNAGRPPSLPPLTVAAVVPVPPANRMRLLIPERLVAAPLL